MKKLVFSILFLNLFFLPVSACAQEPKLIQLRDGSTLTGNVVELNSGVYTIKTENLGVMKIKEEDIVSISNKRFADAQALQAAPVQAGTPAPSLTKSNLNSQVQLMQQNILSDPAMMADLQELVSDPEIVQILTDETFMSTIMNLDMEAIEKDPKYQKLMHNYKMRTFIEKLKSKQQN